MDNLQPSGQGTAATVGRNKIGSGLLWLLHNTPQALLAGHTARVLPQPQCQGWKLHPATLEEELKVLPHPLPPS